MHTATLPDFVLAPGVQLRTEQDLVERQEKGVALRVPEGPLPRGVEQALRLVGEAVFTP